jgi:hypothetical protein
MGKGGSISRRARLAVVIGGAAALTAAASPARAIAADAYASPGGAGDCSAGDPCSLHAAVSTVTGGDDVLLADGTYTLTAGTGSLSLSDSTLKPRVPGTRPVINAVDGRNVVSDGSGRLEDVTIVASGLSPGTAALEFTGGGRASRVAVVATGVSPIGVLMVGAAELFDSTVWTTSTAGKAIRTGIGGAIIRNVTGVATGSGSVGLHAEGEGGIPQSTGVVNSIFRGSTTDVLATATSADSNIDIDYSDYVTSSDAPPAAQINEGTFNISGAPVFRNASAGDFRQCPGSPTIDKGTTTPSTIDFDGDARSLGAAADIGADEFTGAECPAPPTTTPQTPVPTPKKCKKGRKLKKGKCVKKKRKRRKRG